MMRSSVVGRGMSFLSPKIKTADQRELPTKQNTRSSHVRVVLLGRWDS